MATWLNDAICVIVIGCHYVHAQTAKKIGSFSYAEGSGYTVAVRFLYPVDLNADGLDELIFAGFETQPNTPANYSNTRMTIFGWEAGRFIDLTRQWLPDGADRVEGVGDIGFGDFDGNGQLDAFLSAYVDMDHRINSYALLNRGDRMEKIRVEADFMGWQHGVAVADVNGDGFDDVYAAGYGESTRVYLGVPQGLSAVSLREFGGGSGVALGDFLGDGSVLVLLVDHAAASGRDSALYRLSIDSGRQASLQLVSALPTARIDLPQFGLTSDPFGQSHDVRARAFDFSGDGLLDVLVFSRKSFDGEKWPEISQIQFLQNLGGGSFSDVTDRYLPNYRAESNVAYSPVFIDLDGDGRTDIFISDSSYEGDHDSTSVLLQQNDGTFLDTSRDAFSALVSDNGGTASVVRGPEGRKYLVTEQHEFGGQATVRMSEIILVHQPLMQLAAAEGETVRLKLASTLFPALAKSGKLRFSAEDLPDWLTLNTRKGTLAGTLGYDAADAGDLLIRIDAASARGETMSVLLTLAVANVTQPTGSRKADRLVAGDGDDRIAGGNGKDTLTGGGGSDVFVFDTRPGKNNLDVITDFSQDKIVLAASIFSALKNGITADNFVLGSPQDANDFLVYRDGMLFYDPDGVGSKLALAVVQLIGAPALWVDDIWVE